MFQDHQSPSATSSTVKSLPALSTVAAVVEEEWTAMVEDELRGLRVPEHLSTGPRDLSGAEG